jgi:hypothetical protein
MRRSLARRLIAARQPLADGDEPPFDEHELDIAAGVDEKHAAASSSTS